MPTQYIKTSFISTTKIKFIIVMKNPIHCLIGILQIEYNIQIVTLSCRIANVITSL